ncbi:MAG: PadR family transcriptional regulator [Actinobacteria bacterium]|nr:PadR family transcriptional regulator [Actinomycetota bacterium]
MSPGSPRGHQRRRRGHGNATPARCPSSPPSAPIVAGPGTATGIGPGDYKRSLIETALLITLCEEKGHGYALVERVEQLIGDQFYIDPGSIYRILRSLEEAGMITSSWETGTAGPLRRTYTVKPSGRQLLQTWADVLTDRGKTLLRLSEMAREQLT